MKKLEIHITGPQGSGKTRLRNLIETALREGTKGGNAHLHFKGQDIAIFEHTPGPEHVNCRCESITPLEVYSHPLEKRGSLPFVSFAPGNGWAIKSASKKGCHHPELQEAVNDWNRGIVRLRDEMSIMDCELTATPVQELPGWGDAVRDEMNTRHAAKVVAEETAKGHEAGKRVHTAGAGKARSPLFSLLTMAALMGAFDGFGADEMEPALDGPPSDAMRELLEASTVLHVCPHGSAVLAVPRALGEQWATQLVENIKADNIPAVRVMLETAGLMK
jgi:energy-coupling factor transporter ATP-binding protein EcfA2